MVDSVLTFIWNVFCLKIVQENNSQIDISMVKKYYNIPGNRLMMYLMQFVIGIVCVITIYCIIVTVKTLAAHVSTNNISVESNLILF